MILRVVSGYERRDRIKIHPSEVVRVTRAKGRKKLRPLN